ncbi:hypothetical protein OKJ48_00185 [Streptomyces kunmingensis]|uniref:Uncharacterized protein n=1 Tax=Streptomyces kunmingensis TaxID=68225 RepID=A0ABU6C2C7_9ACTN|nr:hypothetical protein [Streptomyces kunmingensis]MEB3958684.1 hypothetical protein [Streptomyces kunmingensis]
MQLLDGVGQGEHSLSQPFDPGCQGAVRAECLSGDEPGDLAVVHAFETDPGGQECLFGLERRRKLLRIVSRPVLDTVQIAQDLLLVCLQRVFARSFPVRGAAPRVQAGMASA